MRRRKETKRRKLSKTLLLALAPLAVVALASLLVVAAEPLKTIASQLYNAYTNVGIPVPSETKKEVVEVESNKRVIDVLQAGEMRISLVRAWVTDVNALQDNQGLITGFEVTVKLLAANQATVRVKATVKLYNGTIIEGEASYELNPGLSKVSVQLKKPVNPNDIIALNITATPTT